MNDRMISIVIMGKSGMIFAGVVEDLKGEVEILLANDHSNEALGIETLRPGLDRRRNGVGLNRRINGEDETKRKIGNWAME